MKKIIYDPVGKFSLSFIALVILFIVLKELQIIFIPLVIAYFLFFIFEPFNNYLEKKKFPQSITTIIDLIIIILLIWGISRFIIESFSQFGDTMPVYEQKLNSIVSNAAKSFGITEPLLANFNIKSILADIDYGGIASGLFSSTLSIFSSSFFVLFFFIFVSSGHKKIIEAIKKRFIQTHATESVNNLLNDADENDDSFVEAVEVQIEAEKGKEIEQTFKDITHQVQQYITTKTLISLITGLLVALVLWLFDVDFLIVWAVLAFVLNFIPNIGSAIAVLLPSIMALIQYESFTYALIIAGIITVLQNIMGNIVEPKIYGNKLGLNPLVILLALLLWGYIWGIVGMFISVPLTAVLKIIISNSKSKNLQFISELMGN